MPFLIASFALVAFAPSAALQSADPSASGVRASASSAEPREERAAVREARELLLAARAARERREFPAASTALARAATTLLASPPTVHDAEEESLWIEIGSMAHDLGVYESARAVRAEVLRQREARLGPDDPKVAAARSSLALTSLRLGDTAGARALQERVIEVFERTLPPDHADLAKARANLASTRYMQGDLEGARSLQVQVLEVRERTRSGDDIDLARARSNLAGTLAALGDVRGALTLQELVLATRERALQPDDPELSRARQNLAITLRSLGDLHGARALEERVLEVRVRTLPAQHPDLAAARLNLATTLCLLGDLQTGRAMQEQVVDAFEQSLPPDSRDLAAARTNLAITLEGLGDFAAARVLQERVLAVLERTLPADHLERVLARQRLAITLTRDGDPSAALSIQEGVLESLARTLPAEHPEVTRARENLALLVRRNGDVPRALALQRSVLAIREPALPPDHPDLAMARQNLALMSNAVGDLRAARELYAAVLATHERTLPEGHPLLTASRGNMASVTAAMLASDVGSTDLEERRRQLAQLAVDMARGSARESRAIVVDGSARQVEERLASQAEGLDVLISLALGRGPLDLGADVVRETFLACESNRGGASIAALLAKRGGNRDATRELRANVARAAAEMTRLAQGGDSAEETDRAREVLDEAERALSRRTVELLGAETLAEPSVESLTRGLERTTALVAWRKAKTWDLGRGEAPGSELSERLVAFVVRSGDPSLTGSAGSAGPRTTLVDLGPIAPIRVVADRLLAGIGAARERGLAAIVDESADEAGAQLRVLVLDPLRAPLAGVERLVVVPDDVLNAIPLDALPAGAVWSRGQDAGQPRGDDAGQLLGDVLRIERRASLLETLLPRVEQPGAAVLLALGHPAFDMDPAGAEELAQVAEPAPAVALRSAEQAGLLRATTWERGFATLPGTRAEVRGIAQYFEDAYGESAPAIVLERREASSAALTRLSSQARWLHVATHGWFAPESVRSSADPVPIAPGLPEGARLDEATRVRGMSPMLLCGLALGGANLPVNSVGRIPGLVTAQEIAALDLSNCDLAVLSACDTNVGVQRAGQGVASLQRALQMAGARSVITSLWKVPDEATKDLMLEFYRRLWIEKQPKHAALWAAKKKLRTAKDERGQPIYTPRDWAGWVLSGEPD